MLGNGLVRLNKPVVPGGGQTAAETGLVRKVEAPAVVEKTLEETSAEQIDILERGLRAERELGERAFALETFANHGGQGLMSKFGVARVLDTLPVLARDKTAPSVSVFELVKQLEPDKKKRAVVYTEIEETSRAALAKKEAEEQRLAERNDAGEGERFARVYRDLDRSRVLGAEFTANACRVLDSFVGGVFANGEKALLRLGLAPLHTDAVNGGLEKLKTLLTSSEVSGDLSVAVDQMDQERQGMREARLKQTAELMNRLESEIRTITANAEAELAGKMNPVLRDLQETLTKHGESTTGEKLLTSIAEAVQKDLTAMQESMALVINQKTAELRKQLARAASVARQ